jgi:hypothetical protein
MHGGGSMDSVASAFVASTEFANDYNGGTSINPNSAPTVPITQEIIDHALGSSTASQVNGWANAGLPVAKMFEAFALAISSATLKRR